MADGVYEGSREDGCEQVPKGVSLLQHSRDDTSSSLGAIFQGRGSNVSVQSTHGNSKKRSHAQELVVGVAEPGAHLQDDEEDIIDDERPFAAISISSNSESDGTDGSQHQHESDAPRDVLLADVKGLGEAFDSQRDREKVESAAEHMSVGAFGTNA
jgi:hypothetical protein